MKGLTPILRSALNV